MSAIKKVISVSKTQTLMTVLSAVLTLENWWLYCKTPKLKVTQTLVTVLSDV
jgi:hypothetical protein